MKTKAELGHDIVRITLKIYEEFPELYTSLKEMPVISLEKDVINSTNLENYYSYLVERLEKYSKMQVVINELRNTHSY